MAHHATSSLLSNCGDISQLATTASPTVIAVSANPCRFMTLPYELRTIIYECALYPAKDKTARVFCISQGPATRAGQLPCLVGISQPCCLCFITAPDTCPRPHHQCVPSSSLCPYLDGKFLLRRGGVLRTDILRVSKLISAEALPFLYRNLSLIVRAGRPTVQLLSRFLAPLSVEARRSMRSIFLRLDTNHHGAMHLLALARHTLLAFPLLRIVSVYIDEADPRHFGAPFMTQDAHHFFQCWRRLLQIRGPTFVVRINHSARRIERVEDGTLQSFVVVNELRTKSLWRQMSHEIQRRKSRRERRNTDSWLTELERTTGIRARALDDVGIGNQGNGSIFGP